MSYHDKYRKRQERDQAEAPPSLVDLDDIVEDEDDDGEDDGFDDSSAADAPDQAPLAKPRSPSFLAAPVQTGGDDEDEDEPPVEEKPAPRKPKEEPRFHPDAVEYHVWHESTPKREIEGSPIWGRCTQPQLKRLIWERTEHVPGRYKIVPAFPQKNGEFKLTYERQYFLIIKSEDDPDLDPQNDQADEPAPAPRTPIAASNLDDDYDEASDDAIVVPSPSRRPLFEPSQELFPMGRSDESDDMSREVIRTFGEMFNRLDERMAARDERNMEMFSRMLERLDRRRDGESDQSQMFLKFLELQDKGIERGLALAREAERPGMFKMVMEAVAALGVGGYMLRGGVAAQPSQAAALPSPTAQPTPRIVEQTPAAPAQSPPAPRKLDIDALLAAVAKFTNDAENHRLKSEIFWGTQIFCAYPVEVVEQVLATEPNAMRDRYVMHGHAFPPGVGPDHWANWWAEVVAVVRSMVERYQADSQAAQPKSDAPAEQREVNAA